MKAVYWGLSEAILPRGLDRIQTVWGLLETGDTDSRTGVLPHNTPQLKATKVYSITHSKFKFHAHSHSHFQNAHCYDLLSGNLLQQLLYCM